MSLPYQAVLFDLSGVLYEGSRAVPGARRAVANAREAGLVIRFVTNTATKCREDVLDKLDRVVLREVLRHLDGNQVRAAERLGMSRTTLRAKLRSVGLDQTLFRRSD